MMDFKSAVAKYYSTKNLSRLQLLKLNQIQSSSSLSKPKVNIQWSIVALSLILAASLAGQWYMLNNQNLNSEASLPSTENDLVTKSLVLSVTKQLVPAYPTNSFNDLNNHFSALEFRPSLNMADLPLKDSRLIGASYAMFGDSIGILLTFYSEELKRSFTVIQKPLTKANEGFVNKETYANGIKVKMWADKGLFTAVAW